MDKLDWNPFRSEPTRGRNSRATGTRITDRIQVARSMNERCRKSKQIVPTIVTIVWQRHGPLPGNRSEAVRLNQACVPSIVRTSTASIFAARIACIPKSVSS